MATLAALGLCTGWGGATFAQAGPPPLPPELTKALEELAASQKANGDGATDRATTDGAETGTAPAHDPLLPQVTRFRVLNIPFELREAPEHTREVQLLVSRDGGVSWNVESVATPREDHFEFSTDRDGEYWFAVRTLDRLGNMRPAGTPQPEAKLIIDSTRPDLRLTAEMTPEGRIAVRWQTHDFRLQADSLRLEYRPRGVNEWFPFPVEPLGEGSPNSPSAGQVAWLPPVDGDWELRATVADSAGNITTVVQPALKAEETNAAAAEQAGMHSAIAGQQPTKPLPLGTFGQTTAPPIVSPFGQADSATVAQNNGTGAGLPANADPARNQSWAPANQRVNRQQQNAVADRTAQNNGNASDRYGTPLLGTNNGDPQSDAWNSTTQRGPVRPIGLAYGDAVAADAADGREMNREPVRSIIPTTAPIAPAEPILYVNTLRFDLEYRAQTASIALDGDAAVRDVEVWGTDDAGRTWRRYAVGKNTDVRVTVNVPTPGRYGFRLVEIDRSSLQMPPHSGDQPEVWVEIDLTSPACQLITATQGDDQHLNELTITWTAQDQALAPGGITLQYADTPEGPWQTIVSGAENSGRYVWRMTANTPERFHLRLIAVDQAGNYGEHVSLSPVRPLRPEFGRITGVRPAGSEDRSTQSGDAGDIYSARRGQ